MSAQGLDGGNDARRIAHETKRTDLVQRTLYVGFPMTVDSVYQVNVEGSLERRSRLGTCNSFCFLSTQVNHNDHNSACEPSGGGKA